MNLFIFGANWYNHGDESAIRSMIYEIKAIAPEARIKIEFNQQGVIFPDKNIEVFDGFTIPSIRCNPIGYIGYKLSVISSWRVVALDPLTRQKYDNFINAVKWCDYAIYAPGGPSFGDIYHQYNLVEMMYLIHKYGKPYFFYAPSMGPFTRHQRHIRTALENSDFICLREATSKQYLKEAGVNKELLVTLDSAFQFPIDWNAEEKKMEKYPELKEFITTGKCVGLTITDLRWHDREINVERENRIKESFEGLVDYLEGEGYKLLFIPQLFGVDNDSDYMKRFMRNDNCYIISPNEDCYFQQFLISKLYAVVGMRYHSNIFSAKVGTPFLSVAYEQKMSGFINKAGFGQYCINISDLNRENLLNKFKLLEKNYDEYKTDLQKKRESFISESHKTTEKLFECFREHSLV